MSRRSKASIPTCACGRSSRTAARSRSASSSSARSTTRWGSQVADPDYGRGHAAARWRRPSGMVLDGAPTRSRRPPGQSARTGPRRDGSRTRSRRPRRLSRVLSAQLLQASDLRDTTDANAERCARSADRLRALPRAGPFDRARPARGRRRDASTTRSEESSTASSRPRRRSSRRSHDGTGVSADQAADLRAVRRAQHLHATSSATTSARRFTSATTTASMRRSS